MKSTGIVRKIDDLGRIVLPRELRKVLEINDRDPIEIFVDGNFIILQKYEPSCIFCASAENVNGYKGKNICGECMRDLKKTS